MSTYIATALAHLECEQMYVNRTCKLHVKNICRLLLSTVYAGQPCNILMLTSTCPSRDVNTQTTSIFDIIFSHLILILRNGYQYPKPIILTTVASKIA